MLFNELFIDIKSYLCAGSVLKRWKRCHLVLYQDGSLRHFEDEHKPVADDATHMKSCLGIQTGSNVSAYLGQQGCLVSACLCMPELPKLTATACLGYRGYLVSL